ncbi:MAG: hypothetical protein WCT37_02355 [Patescibacteria group bacterium]|jgi:hypothetical protein
MTKNFTGVVIKESLERPALLGKITITKTKVEKITARHQTPWLKKWTLHSIEVPEGEAEIIAKKLSLALDSRHSWYADFKNDKIHYIIFHGRVFKINRRSAKQYAEAKQYGISLGIPAYQVNFRPMIKK